MTDHTRVLDSQPPPGPRGRRQKRRRMSRGQRWIIRFLLLAVLLAAVAVGTLFLVEFRMGDAGTLAALSPGNGVYLVVGTDSRENLPDDLEGNFGNFAGARADVIMLMQVVDGRRQLLSIPRDLRVEIPGNSVNRINAAYAFGGPGLLTETVTTETGLAINHYMEVEFGGFAAIVDALGGIELDFPYPARDAKSGLNVERAGRQTVDGATALAYARSREYQEQRDGQWVAARQGDIERTGRQQEVMLQILSRASSPGGLVRSPAVINQVTGNLTVDSSVSTMTLLRTGWNLRSASESETATLPVVGQTEGGVAYLVRSEPAATEMLRAFEAGRRLTDS